MKLNKNYIPHNLNKIPKSSKKLTKEKAYILGTLCGDGWISTGYRIGLKVVDKDFAEHFRNCLKKAYPINCSISKRTIKPNNYCENPKVSYVVSMVSKLVVQDLNKYSETFKTKEWMVPRQILNSSQEIQAQFIKGFADSEGSVKNRHRNREIILCSGNYKGIKDIQRILINTFGMNSYYSIRKNGVHILATSDYRSLKIFYDEIGFIIKRKMSNLEQGLARYKRKGIRKYSKEFKQLAMELMQQGLTYSQVGKLMGTSPANIYDWWKKNNSF